MNEKNRIEWSLFLLRLGVFVVMAMWTIDKIISPDHAAKVFENFYFISGLRSEIMMGVGLVEMLIILAFLAGLWKRFTYGFVLVVHGISTLSSWKQYLEPNLLFFAAWPMLAACAALYLLRDWDRKFAIHKN
ncbi:conserved hypothetical protein [Nitrosococcus halophilus Nc 4]|uniref:DoxX family protein n=1 Tax=Nitrosococcus halophilus (strain Nc4) TaxID=472759 RepID=D5BYL8_NITHN|nr:hypothetical protein [Nitrosococcus halophilus]ADE16006.1 conserved hypothetical protein [Nitrosococcus halophilus Nc 4]